MTLRALPMNLWSHFPCLTAAPCRAHRASFVWLVSPSLALTSCVHCFGIRTSCPQIESTLAVDCHVVAVWQIITYSVAGQAHMWGPPPRHVRSGLAPFQCAGDTLIRSVPLCGCLWSCAIAPSPQRFDLSTSRVSMFLGSAGPGESSSRVDI